MEFRRTAGGCHLLRARHVVPRTFTDRTRGRFFATTQLLSGVTAVVIAGFVVHSVLSSASIPYPRNYALLAALSTAMYLVSLIGVLAIREPSAPSEEPNTET